MPAASIWPRRRSQLAQANATLPPLLKQQAQPHDLLAVLTGRFPSQARPSNSRWPSLQPAAGFAGEPALHTGGAAPRRAAGRSQPARGQRRDRHRRGNRLPNIQLTANAGSTALAIGQLFTPGTGFWNLGAALAAPIFQGGTLLHQERAARAAYDQAAQQYRSTVLTAFQNVADTLVGAATGCGRPEGRRRRRRTPPRHARHHATAIAGRLCRLARAA